MRVRVCVCARKRACVCVCMYMCVYVCVHCDRRTSTPFSGLGQSETSPPSVHSMSRSSGQKTSSTSTLQVYMQSWCLLVTPFFSWLTFFSSSVQHNQTGIFRVCHAPRTPNATSKVSLPNVVFLCLQFSPPFSPIAVI